MRLNIKNGDNPVINATTGRSLNKSRTTYLFVILGTYLVNSKYCVCEKLAKTYVLGEEFCEKIAQYTNKIERMFDLDDGTSIEIIRNLLKRFSESVPLPYDIIDYNTR